MLIAALPSAAQVAQDEVTTPGLHYMLDVGFSYIDRHGRPSFSMIQPPDNSAEANDGAHRSLGLTRLRLALDWIAFTGADFHLVLRPDALNRKPDENGDVREFDSRAGDLYRKQAPLMRPVDSYHVRFASGDAFASALGVFESLVPPVGAYPSMLDFGLAVRMPAKYAGLEFSWRNFAAPTGSAVHSGVGIDVIAMHGDEDRVESLAYKSESYDVGPEASDPYYGVGLRTRWIPTSAMTLGLVTATNATEIEGGRKTETIVQLYSEVVFDYLAAQPKIALEFRMATENWRSDLLDIAAKTQRNVALTSSIRTGRKTWLLVGAYLGRSDRDGIESTAVNSSADGYQVEAGVLGKFDKQLSWQFLTNEERREIVDENGAVRGGFVNTSGDRRTLRRMAFGLKYLLDANG